MADSESGPLDFQVRFLFPSVRTSRQRLRTWNPLAFLAAVRAILKSKPDLLIVSLWRSCIVGILVRTFRSRIKLVVLIHNSVDAHWLDYLFTRWAMALSSAVWADSEASVELRFRNTLRRQVTIIPFMTRRIAPARAVDTMVPPTPQFIFWGRLAPQKNLERAIRLFHRIWQARPSGRFTIIGPDAGEKSSLQALCSELGLTAAVRFMGEMSFEGIRELATDHFFYLQTSAYEGMAMSVVEGMQLGLVPVVTPVGEIGRYCLDNENAVIVDSDERTATSILRLLDEPAAYAELRRKAVHYWHGRPIYREAVIAECLRLVGP
ncbi:glycosyltransferase family 4 protein [Dokdonella immobilis]|uniref:Glycosyltransferase involved in cell wall bisynthesis n=1 Tax=Dokdonella immobilis TaxID=578942 RepID=A0A1I4Y102_9GAMM|nr:glycosyltransferase family 4 protein [Dokdonella immobilis]SFN31727.1 Glycosyltransferase involved in cell wall bisynthesis [Dokdonella immobilis]